MAVAQQNGFLPGFVLGDPPAPGAKLVGPALKGAMDVSATAISVLAAPGAGSLAKTAGQQALARTVVGSQNAGFGAGVGAGIAAQAAGAPTPAFPGNGTFNAGAKFGAVVGRFGKFVFDQF